jgi:RNase H-fold protein (predicted Holliday junction resolvase)
MGVKKKKRQEKSQIDSMAAALVLQGYLDSHKNQLK